MSKLVIGAAITLASAFAMAQTPSAAGAMAPGHPCQPKHQAKHAAREALHACIATWAKDENPAAAAPTDDCSNKLVVFIQAAKDAKACHQAQHGTKTN